MFYDGFFLLKLLLFFFTTELFPTSPISVKNLPQTSNQTPLRGKDIFGAEPFGNNGADPFGMGDFGSVVTPSDTESNLNTGLMNRRITEMQEGFSRGISFEGDDFDLGSLDPLRL